MPAVSRRRSIALLVAGLAAAAIGSLPAIAAGDTPGLRGHSTTTTPPPASSARPAAEAGPPRAAKPAHLSVYVHGVRRRQGQGGQARPRGRLPASVRARPARAGEAASPRPRDPEAEPEGRRVRGQNAGRYRFRSPALIKPAGYRIVARHLRQPQQRQRHRPLAQVPHRLPGPRSGRPQQRRPDLQPPARTRGLLLDPRQALQQQDRLRGDGLPQDQRDEPHLQRQRRRSSRSSPTAGAASTSSTRAPASTWRSTSRGR